MKIILSPAKKMIVDADAFLPEGLPANLHKTKEILNWLRRLSYDDLQRLWCCNDNLAQLNYKRICEMELESHLTPAILAYEGIAYQYMAPTVFEDGHFDYVQENLRILSAFYGVLKPMDGVTPYRLEMQAKARIGACSDLYEYWGEVIYNQVIDESRVIINLASKEYSKCIEKYLNAKDTYVTITFCEEAKGKLVTKGTYAKMARGDMVRFMAENAIENPLEIKGYNRLGYIYRDDLSSDSEYVFERNTRDISLDK